MLMRLTIKHLELKTVCVVFQGRLQGHKKDSRMRNRLFYTVYTH